MSKNLTDNLTDAKLLASSIADALDILYNFNVMESGNTPDEVNKSNGTLFTIQAAAEKLSDMMEVL